jgi:hypothetical protein
LCTPLGLWGVAVNVHRVFAKKKKKKKIGDVLFGAGMKSLHKEYWPFRFHFHLKIN